MTERFSNNPITTLNGGINSSVTSLVVSDPSLFPTQPNFRIKILNELLLVTGVSSSTFTVTRGVEGTTAADHANGESVVHVLTAGAMTLLVQNDDSRLSDDRISGQLRTSSTVVIISGAAAPSAGQALVATDSTHASWQTISSGSTNIINTTSSTYNVQATDTFIAIGAITVACSVILPSSPTTGESHEVKDATGLAATYNITINGNGNNIDGASTYVLSNNYESVRVVWNGTLTKWMIV